MVCRCNNRVISRREIRRRRRRKKKANACPEGWTCGRGFKCPPGWSCGYGYAYNMNYYNRVTDINKIVKT